MSWTLRFSPEARRDIQSIAVYLRREASARAAGRYLRDIHQRLARLSEAPKVGVALPEQGHQTRFVPCRRHVIYYQLDAKQIVVLRVLHAAQDRSTIMSGKDDS